MDDIKSNIKYNVKLEDYGIYDIILFEDSNLVIKKYDGCLKKYCIFDKNDLNNPLIKEIDFNTIMEVPISEPNKCRLVRHNVRQNEDSHDTFDIIEIDLSNRKAKKSSEFIFQRRGRGLPFSYPHRIHKELKLLTENCISYEIYEDCGSEYPTLNVFNINEVKNYSLEYSVRYIFSANNRIDYDKLKFNFIKLDDTMPNIYCMQLSYANVETFNCYTLYIYFDLSERFKVLNTFHCKEVGELKFDSDCKSDFIGIEDFYKCLEKHDICQIMTSYSKKREEIPNDFKTKVRKIVKNNLED